MSLIALAGWVHLPAGRERQQSCAEYIVISGRLLPQSAAGQRLRGILLQGARGAGCWFIRRLCHHLWSWQLQEMAGCPLGLGGCVALGWTLLEQATRTGLETLTVQQAKP